MPVSFTEKYIGCREIINKGKVLGTRLYLTQSVWLDCASWPSATRKSFGVGGFGHENTAKFPMGCFVLWWWVETQGVNPWNFLGGCAACRSVHQNLVLFRTKNRLFSSSLFLTWARLLEIRLTLPNLRLKVNRGFHLAH